MKILVIAAVGSLLSMGLMQSAQADSAKQKMVRNDRVQVSKQIAQYDINPFVDSRRVMRNDRVQYSFSKVKKVAEKQPSILRNDRVRVIKKN
ncbi:hypothetical protein [Acinetobacter sp. YH12142]|uniref:hypothetical protein n=1 Tax=Acinetobacter sp. YH12142 TaxID=2601126 RepID=UPI0015D10748|nr:hypothetical protein [Acinetobacter sp. YH12142]